jgi:hypothetical protein
METKVAREILQSLADGIDPTSGEVLEGRGPFNDPQVVRALYKAIQCLDKKVDNERKRGGRSPNPDAPPNAGKPWTAEEERVLIRAFNAGSSSADLAKTHQRTPGAIESRLEKLGLIEKKIVPWA